MKFAQEFKAAMRSGDYPEPWCKAAIPYPTLKKCLNKVRAELEDMGLDADTLRQLLTAQAQSADGAQVPLAKYKFLLDASDVHPRLSIWVQVEDGALVHASLSPASRTFLQRQADKRRVSENSENSNSENPETASVDDDDAPPSLQRIEVSLTADSEFFGLIHRDMAELERLGHEERALITRDVVALGHEIGQVARPQPKRNVLAKMTVTVLGKHSAQLRDKDMLRYATDITTWREIFELYVRAQVFFSTREVDRNTPGATRHDAAAAARQLDWFQDRVRALRLVESLQLPASRQAFDQFLQLNKRLYLNLRFREFNQTAQTKILKKFDKVTALGASTAFPQARMQFHDGTAPDAVVVGLARDVCARIAEDVVAVVPRFEDYMCPVCMSLAWFPIRLPCAHLFCARCLVKLQRANKDRCPLCRVQGVLAADTGYLDKQLAAYMKLYFKAEVADKHMENVMEVGVEMFGESYKTGPRCSLM